MAARICGPCDLAYEATYGGLCRCCDGTLRYSILTTPQPDVLQRAAKRRASARVERAKGGFDEAAKIFANRLYRFTHAGLDYDASVHIAGLKHPDRNEFVVDPARFEQLVAQGCAPHLVADILR